MTYTVKLIEHTDTREKERFLRLIDLLSVYEEKGFVKLILTEELHYLERKGKFETPFHIVKVYNDKDALVGYSFYYVKEKTCEFYVLPHWRGKGIGTLMVTAMRENWSGDSVLSAYRGFQGWANFFERNFILELDQFEAPAAADIEKYGDSIKARAAMKRSAKLKLFRRMVKAGITTVKTRLKQYRSSYATDMVSTALL